MGCVSMDFFVETAANFRKFRRQQTMKTIFALAVVLLLSMRAPAEIQAPVPLWPDGTPGALQQLARGARLRRFVVGIWRKGYAVPFDLHTGLKSRDLDPN